MVDILNFVGGKLQSALNAGWIENLEPATAKVYSRLPDSDDADLESAINAAEAAFVNWSKTSPFDRAVILRKIGTLIRADLDNLARAESRDTGKPVSLALQLDIPRAAQNFEFFADAITQFTTPAHAGDPGVVNFTLRPPLGVVACISPWNLPLYLLSWKIAPALAAGNTVIAKPSEVTPMSAYLLSQICIQAGLPPGVLNIVHGTGPRIGAPLCAHPRIKAVSFTGSTATGRAIAQATAGQFKKISLEMGGKNPAIIFADCNFDRAVEQTLRSAFLNQGQICLCGSRILIQKSIYSRFKTALVEAAQRLQQGDPLEADTQQGALVSRAHYEKVLGAISRAVSEGGSVLCGGKTAKITGRCTDGWFVEPTLIEGLGAECSTNQEEIFGPVATLIPFEDEAEALKLANQTRYGLAASIWTQNLSRAHQLARDLEFGIVWINCWMLRDLRTPFGGVKESGVGREGGEEALRFFTEPKNVCIRYEEFP